MDRLKGRVSDDTYAMLEYLVSIKENKHELSKKQRNFHTLVTVSVALLIFNTFYYVNIHQEGNILFVVISAFFGNFYNIILVGVTALLWFKYIHNKNKFDKVKKNLEELRLESIDHLKNSWEINMHSPLRDEISKIMKEKYGINVRYKFNK